MCACFSAGEGLFRSEGIAFWGYHILGTVLRSPGYINITTWWKQPSEHSKTKQQGGEMGSNDCA